MGQGRCVTERDELGQGNRARDGHSCIFVAFYFTSYQCLFYLNRHPDCMFYGSVHSIVLSVKNRN